VIRRVVNRDRLLSGKTVNSCLKSMGLAQSNAGEGRPKNKQNLGGTARRAGFGDGELVYGLGKCWS